MKKKLVLSFILISTLLFSQSETRVNSTSEKISAIDAQIEEFMRKKQSLEKLKNKFLEKDVPLNEINKVSEKRPKVALVLSGGGAKGAAHIGVLKVIEKYNVPIDYILGTSAGSIVAAMYSIGYTPDEIQKTITALNFNKLFTNTSSREFEDIIQKTNTSKYPLTLSISKDFKLSLPMGVLTGEHIYLQLKEIFGKAESINNFYELPIPFKAMTTDLQTGKSVGESSGDLALSTLKSMAIPTFLDPIRDGDKYYIDGGVADNLPIIEAINMGADIVIGVDISADSVVISDNSNIIEILDKLSTYNGDVSIKNQKNLPDILITPDVKNHSTLDFDNLDGLVKEGEISAESLDYVWKTLSNPKAFRAIKEKAEKLKPLEVKIKNIKLVGNKVLTEKEVMELKPKQEIMDRKALNLWAEKVYATNYVDRVFYKVEDDTVKFIVREKIDNKLNAGLSYASNYGAGLEISAEIPVLKKIGISKKNYTIKTELSKYPKIFLKDLSSYKIFKNELLVSGEISYGYDPIFIYKNDQNISTYRSDKFEASISTGTTLFNKAILGYSLGFKNIGTEYASGLELKKLTKFKESGSFFTNGLTIYYDTLNANFYPTEGTKVLTQAFIVNPTSGGDFFQGYFYSGNLYFPLSKKVSMNTGVNGGLIERSENAPLSELFSIGGLRNDVLKRSNMFYGLPLGAIRTDEYFAGVIGLKYSLFNSLHLMGRYNMATYNYESTSYNGISLGHSKEVWKDKVHGYGIGLGWDTFLGPMDFVLSNNALTSGVLFQVHIGYIF
ncbi:MAG: patatin-like phospholipase family protein [Fusobacteriaceae bacterium]